MVRHGFPVVCKFVQYVQVKILAILHPLKYTQLAMNFTNVEFVGNRYVVMIYDLFND